MCLVSVLSVVVTLVRSFFFQVAASAMKISELRFCIIESKFWSLVVRKSGMDIPRVVRHNS